MPPVVLKAHYDGQHIVPDEPVNLPKDAPLAVTIVPFATPEDDAERDAWFKLGAQHLASAYGDDEPEYSLDDLKP